MATLTRRQLFLERCLPPRSVLTASSWCGSRRLPSRHRHRRPAREACLSQPTWEGVKLAVPVDLLHPYCPGESAVAERPSDRSRGFQPTARIRQEWLSRGATAEAAMVLRWVFLRRYATCSFPRDRFRGLKPTARVIVGRYAAKPSAVGMRGSCVENPRLRATQPCLLLPYVRSPLRALCFLLFQFSYLLFTFSSRLFDFPRRQPTFIPGCVSPASSAAWGPPPVRTCRGRSLGVRTA
jgi:hypothetical protein